MTPRLAYLVSRYPKLSETFVADEIEALVRGGTDLAVCALLRSREASPPLRAPIVASFGEALAAQLHWLVRAPRCLLAIWCVALARHGRSPRRLAQAVLGVGAASALAIRLRRSGIEHVHAHFATHAALAAWVIRRLTGIPYSFTAHADDIFVRRPMLEEKVAEAAFVVTISAFNQRFLVSELGAWAAPRIRVIHCGVATDAFAPVALPEGGAPFTILCVGRLEEKKGQRHLIEACRRLAERGVAFRCWLAGEGRERADLERARDAAGLGDRVVLLGAQPRERIRALLSEAHVFVLPSVVTADGRTEGIPVALMEAMAVQRPVVSTNLSGIPELIQDGRSGLLVEPGDAEALAEALARLHADPSWAAQLAREARRVVRERFDLEANVGRLTRLFADGPDAPPESWPAAVAIGSEAGLGGAGR